MIRQFGQPRRHDPHDKASSNLNVNPGTQARLRSLRVSAGCCAFAFALEVIGEAADASAHLPVGCSFGHAAQAVRFVAVMNGQCSAVVLGGDVEVGDGTGDRQFGRLRAD